MMKKYFICFLLLLCQITWAKTVVGYLGKGLDGSDYVYRQTLQTILPGDDWVQKFHYAKNGESLVEFAPANESINDWQNLITIKFTSSDILPYDTTITDIMEHRKNHLAKLCNELSFHVLGQTDTEVTYKWNIKNCGTGIRADQYEIVKMIKGEYGFSSIHYAIKAHHLNKNQENNMLALMQHTQLVIGK